MGSSDTQKYSQDFVPTFCNRDSFSMLQTCHLSGTSKEHATVVLWIVQSLFRTCHGFGCKIATYLKGCAFMCTKTLQPEELPLFQL